MKKRFALLLLFLFCQLAKGQTWQWAKNPKGLGTDFCWDLAVDKLGNSFMTGYFFDSIQFGNNITLKTQPSSGQEFIVKYDQSGVARWAKKLESSRPGNIPCQLYVDKASNSYVMGVFYDTLKIDSEFVTATSHVSSCFEETTSTFVPCPVYQAAIFIAKFDLNSNLIWLKKIAESNELFANGIAVDKTGNSYITGSFSDTLTFSDGSVVHTYNGNPTIFTAKLDHDGNGQWIKKAGGVSSYNNSSYDISVDSIGNSYITGIYIEDVNFDSYSLSGYDSLNRLNMFLAKYNPSGNCAWAKRIGLNDTQSLSMDMDQHGNFFITGDFFFDAVFDAITLTSVGGADLFIAQYDSTGHCIWARRGGGNDDDFGKDIVVDQAGNSFVIGDFRYTANFENKSLSTELMDVCIVKYDSHGHVVWATQTFSNSDNSNSHHNNTNESCRIALGNASDLYINGFFDHTALFGSSILASAGGLDIFICKLIDSASSLGILENNDQQFSTVIFPNPFSYQTTLQTEVFFKNATLTMFNVYGQKVVEKRNIIGQSVLIDRNGLQSGLYSIRLIDDDKTFITDKIVIVDH